MKSSRTVALAVLACFFASSCGQAPGGGGNGETLSVYTHNDPDEMEVFVEDAEKATGLDIEVLNMSAGEGWTRAQAEAPNFGADMQWGQLESMALRAVDAGYLEPYDSPTWDDVPDQFKDPKGRWYGWSYWFNVIGVNTDLLEKKGLDTPDSWADLTDPQYRGKIVLPNPGTSSTGYLFISSVLQLMGEDKGWAYLRKLDKNVGQYASSGTTPAQLVGQGEYAIGISWDQAVFDRVESGYPVKAVFPSEGTGYSLDVVWMFKGTDQREQAEELIDYIGSDEGMKSAVSQRSMVTAPGVTGSAPVDDVEKYLMDDYDAKWAAEHQDAIMKRWRQSFGSK